MSRPDLSPTFWPYLHRHIFAIWCSSSAPARRVPAASTSPARRGHWRRSQGPGDDAAGTSAAWQRLGTPVGEPAATAQRNTCSYQLLPTGDSPAEKGKKGLCRSEGGKMRNRRSSSHSRPIPAWCSTIRLIAHYQINKAPISSFLRTTEAVLWAALVGEASHAREGAV